MVNTSVRGVSASRRFSLTSVVFFLFAMIAVVAIAIPSLAYAGAEPNEAKLNVYAGGTAPSLSEMRASGSDVTVKSSDYMVNGLAPDY